MFFRTPSSLVTAARGCVIMSWVHTGNTESTLDRGDAVSQKKKEKKREREKERKKMLNLGRTRSDDDDDTTSRRCARIYIRHADQTTMIYP